MALNSASDGGWRRDRPAPRRCRLRPVVWNPHTDMNPVLLKPNTDVGAQVIVHGRAIGNMMQAATMNSSRKLLAGRSGVPRPPYRRICKVVVVEGAGSPAEINLRDNDIANMGFAEAADCPVIIIADIDRRWRVRHLVGRWSCCLLPSRRECKDSSSNRFRGDIGLLQPGLDWLERRTGKPVLGVLPYLHGLHLESAGRTRQVVVPGAGSAASAGGCAIAAAHPATIPISTRCACIPMSACGLSRQASPMPPADLIILQAARTCAVTSPGCGRMAGKALFTGICATADALIGICGGFQMLGPVHPRSSGAWRRGRRERWFGPAGHGDRAEAGKTAAPRQGKVSAC